MSEEFIDFKTAVQLKEMGFDKACNSWYSPSGELYKDQSGFSDNTNIHRTSAPTLRQVITFLLRRESDREVKKQSEQVCGLVGCKKTAVNGTSACEDHQRFCE